MTITAVEAVDATDAAFAMDEDAFRLFYERTARGVWAYLAKITGNRQAADDLLQETYYRFLRTRREYADDAHRRNALFAIATNVARDAYRRQRRRPEESPLSEREDLSPDPGSEGVAERVGERTDLTRAMAQLRPRDRELLWLAYAQGFSHQEIAAGLGLRTGSIKLLLSRARHRLLALLRGVGREHA